MLCAQRRPLVSFSGCLDSLRLFDLCELLSCLSVGGDRLMCGQVPDQPDPRGPTRWSGCQMEPCSGL